QTHNINHFQIQPIPTLTRKYRQHQLTALIDFKQAHPEAPVLLVAESQGRQQALLELLQKRGIQPTLVPNWHSFAKAPQEIDWGITVGLVQQGFWHTESQALVVAEPQIYGQRVLQERRRASQGTVTAENVFRSLGELTIGAPVVHIDHGVGRYQGLTRMVVDGQEHEFLLLEYAGNDK